MAFSALALLGLSFLNLPHISWIALFALGLLNGLALYNNILSLGVLVFSCWSVYATRNPSHISSFAAGSLLGYAPMLGFNLANDFISYKILVAKFLGVSRYMVAEQGIFQAVINSFVGKLTGQGPGGFDLAPLYAFPSIFSNTGRPLQTMGLISLLVLIALAYSTFLPGSRRPSKSLSIYEGRSRIAFYASTGLLFILSLSQARYMTALLPFLPLTLCEGISFSLRRQKTLTVIISAVAVFYLAFAHVAAFAQLHTTPDTPPSKPILDTLLAKGLKFGYGSYEYQTSIAFLSQEEIKISTQIGPIYMDKIPRFSQIVDQQKDVFYILPADSAYIRPLIDRDITYQLEKVQGIWLLWDFSERVYPIDLLSPEELARPDGYYRWSYREMPAVLNPYRGGH